MLEKKFRQTLGSLTTWKCRYKISLENIETGRGTISCRDAQIEFSIIFCIEYLFNYVVICALYHR